MKVERKEQPKNGKVSEEVEEDKKKYYYKNIKFIQVIISIF